jgi:hypothetical protein
MHEKLMGTVTPAPAQEPASSSPAETPPTQKKGAKTVDKKGKRGGNHRKGNKFRIPVEIYQNDPKLYGRIYWRCARKGITYEEALKLEKTTDSPSKESVKGTKRKKVHKVATPPSQSDSDKITMPGFTAGSDNISKSSEIERSQQPTEDDIKNRVTALAEANKHFSPPQKSPPSDGIVTGIHVKQIRPDAGRQIFGTATVIERRGEIVSVRNGNGKVHKILAACLQAVGSTEKDKAGAPA